MDLIRTYTLLEAETLEKEAALIAEVLFDLRGAAADTQFTISRGGGWMSFVNPAMLWSGAGRMLAPTELEAKHAALRFFDERREAMRESRRFAESKLPSLVPPDDWLVDAGVFLIPHPHKQQFDHWLCRFGLHVRPGDDLDEPLAEVIGAGIDLRIGAGDEVVAADWRWRPAIDMRSLPRMPRLDEESRIVYRFNDEAARQTFLAPYYEHTEGEHVHLSPASARSLICEIVPSEHGLMAVAQGGSGNYSYTWGRFIAGAFPPAIELLTNASQRRVSTRGGSVVVSEVDFGPHAGDVLLCVRDDHSGAVIQLRRAIYPHSHSHSHEEVRV